MRHPEGEVTIAVVGKYTGLKDAYKSLIEALQHGGIANKVRVNLDWIESEIFEKEDPAPYLERVNGILVPGGFGERGTEGKINAVTFARTRKVPYFGICFGMQMAVIEAARQPRRHRAARARSEFGPTDRAGGRPDDRMAEGQRAGDAAGAGRSRRHHAARRLSGDPAARRAASPRSTATPRSRERHRHRYEVNIDYRERLEEAGLCFSGMSPDNLLPETIEFPDHPWFIGVQYPSGAEVAALRAAPAVRVASSRRRWSRAGWCDATGRGCRRQRLTWRGVSGLVPRHPVPLDLDRRSA